jgi:hypothetical protein
LPLAARLSLFQREIIGGAGDKRPRHRRAAVVRLRSGDMGEVTPGTEATA